MNNITDIFMSNLYKLKWISLRNSGGNKITSVGSIFSNSNDIEYIDMQNFNFGTTNDLDNLFNNKPKLKTIYLSNSVINGTNVTMRYTFMNLPMLETLDLSNIDISNVTVMTGLFQNSNNLNTVYVSNTWNTNNVTSSSDMFSGCTSLVGGAGTTYDATHTDKEYARVDGGSSNPGYLTLKTT